MTPVSSGDQARALIDRIRASLPDGHVREIRMFGAIAVMVDDAMAVAVRKDGSVLVRVDPAADARLLACPGASRAKMGARSMGRGWIRVDATALRSDETLRRRFTSSRAHDLSRGDSPPVRRGSGTGVSAARPVVRRGGEDLSRATLRSVRIRRGRADAPRSLDARRR
jgi:TfoX/Sxy family transcriptional regulator of competence genes